MITHDDSIVELRNEFYRDSFGKIIFVMVGILIAIGILIALSIYITLHKPKPVFFTVDDERRVQPSVAITEAYLTTADVLQWVSNALPESFVYDFVHYNQQLNSVSSYFTKNGWKVFLNQLNNYANYNNVQKNRLFVNGTPAGAPFILNEGLLSGRYAWWIQIPLTITYAGLHPLQSKILTLQVLVVRVSTLDNLSGVAIDNVIVAKSSWKQELPT